MRTLRDFNFNKKKVLVRCDFNIPIDEKGNILDDFRIEQTIPTIKYLVKRGAKIILMSHLGKPKGKFVRSLTLNKIKLRLKKYLNLPVIKLNNCVGREVEVAVDEMRPKDIILLENLRFHKEEERGDLNFAKKIAKLGDIFINEAFSACHRFHASITGIPKYLSHGSGLLLEKEIKNLKKITRKPILPLIAIFGGKEGDFKVINKISKIATSILIGYLIKKQIEEEKVILKCPKKIIFPVDGIEYNNNLDIGPKTLKIFKKEISKAKTIFWSGPLGKIEEKRYCKGTKDVARTIIKSGAFSVVGGGETVEFIRKLNLFDKFSHISTGGSAMLSYLAGDKLPGIEALK
jgi:phosphoglycerate kinase